MNKQTVRDIDLAGKTILVRVDYNVPLTESKVKSQKSKVQVGDVFRIEASLPTLKYLHSQGCRQVLISHLGRPEGKADPKFSLRPVAEKLSKLMDHEIKFARDCVGPEVERQVKELPEHGIILLENLRFHPAEEANDPEFAKQLASLGEVYVNDAFAAAHRAHASTEGVTKYLPAVAGLLLEKEVTAITEALENPKRPLVAIIGGAKISTKLDVLNNLLPRVDTLIIGGAMANTFLAARGHQIGKSLTEPELTGEAKRIISEAADKLILPIDVVVADKLEKDAPSSRVRADAVGDDQMIGDVGHETSRLIGDRIRSAGTIIWNGPLGVAELPAFSAGTRTLASDIAAAAGKSLIGGGDTAAFIDAEGSHDKFGFVSTGGGASLELMAGKQLPGWEALLDQDDKETTKL